MSEADRRSTRPDESTQSPYPMPPGESQWILGRLERLEDKMDGNFREVRSKLDDINKDVNERMKKTEDMISKAKGGLIVLGVLLTASLVVSRLLNVTISFGGSAGGTN